MRIVTKISKMNIVNGPGTKAMLDAVLELNRGRTFYGSDFKSGTYLLFTVENPHTCDVSQVRVRIDEMLSHEDKGSLFPYYLSGVLGNDPVEILYTPDHKELIRGEVVDL